MTVPKWLRGEIDKAIDALDEGDNGENLEHRFSLDDEAWHVQLKKGCRMLEISRKTLDEKEAFSSSKYYTLCIESAFASIERTLHAYLIKKDYLDAEDVVSSHLACFKSAGEAGLFDEECTELIIELWNRNRSRIYYRLALPSKEAAMAMSSLANRLHRYIVNTDTDLAAICICEEK
jgi:hypothetical protein